MSRGEHLVSPRSRLFAEGKLAEWRPRDGPSFTEDRSYWTLPVDGGWLDVVGMPWHAQMTESPTRLTWQQSNGPASCMLRIIPRGGLKVRLIPAWDTHEPVLLKAPGE
eukprot:Skav207321  [mRNA]  locus=scaffold3027:75182:75505:- [translate_table: standard]